MIITTTTNRTRIIWSSNSSKIVASKPILQLLDTGNLVVKNEFDDNSGGSYIWQSFDHPCDTLIPGMKLGWNLRTGQEWFSRLKLPDTSYFLVNKTAVNPVECKEACLSNCSCVAYAKTEVSGCVVWFGDLLDIRVYNEGGQDLYIRMAASELGSSNKSKRTAVIASVSVVSGIILLGLISWSSG
ncbi:unnamed protein product [Ilex paraguariensis]|uniref:Uncharacterized protein n=1 Tax=Ilex paraguariensis TaxID=185542 RepID=A0ABC8UJX2_9AQUA